MSNNKPLELVYSIWVELREHFNTNDRSDSLETIVSVLHEAGYTSEDMHKVFGHDPEVDRIVSEFFEEDVEEDEEDPDDLESYFFDPEEDDY